MAQTKVISRPSRVAVTDTLQPQNGIKRAAAYCRVSTLQEHQEDSFEVQREYYEKYIAENPSMTLIGIYGDHGISGLSARKRPEFKRLMSDCMAGKIDVVLTKSISRFARNLKDCVDCVRLLKSHGIAVIFEKEGITSTDPSSELLFNLLASVAQEESSSLSTNIRWSQEQRNKSGNLYRVTPYGYRKTPKIKGEAQIWYIEESEAERVRLAFSMAAEGYKSNEIRSAMDKLEWRDSTGVVWLRDRLLYLLRNEAYTGDVLTNKVYSPDMLSGPLRNRGQRAQYYIEEHHEPIVSRELFDAVQERLRSGGLQRNIVKGEMRK